MKIPMDKCRKQLMIAWVVGCVILLFVAWLQIVMGHYGEKGRDVIEWLLPAITPTLSLIVGVWANSALKKAKETEKVSKGLYQIVLSASIFYLGFIGLTFAIQPMIPRPPLDIIKDSSLIMAPLQGVMCAFIGIFFTQDSKK
jgi:Zn-dependent protease